MICHRRIHPCVPTCKDCTPGSLAALNADGAPGQTSSERDDNLAQIASIAQRSGLHRIQAVAWRDLDDPEAGGSEYHAHRVLSLWAGAGVDVRLRTSNATGRPVMVNRDGYVVTRRSGRYGVFPSTIASALAPRGRPWDGLVEIWNGMPFFSPLWNPGPRIVFLHHVHAEMWNMVLPTPLAQIGRWMERDLAPRIYRGTTIVTLSESSRDEIINLMGLNPSQVLVVPPGIDSRFFPHPRRSEDPLVLAVGRLVPVKQFDLLIDALAALKRRHPRLQAMIVGEGYLRDELKSRIAHHRAGEWLNLPGRLDEASLLEAYQRAWVLASASAREGWGMTITEAAACATPAVVTRTVGHIDSVSDGITGIVVDSPAELAAGLDALISSEILRSKMGAAARQRALKLSWEATALRTLKLLAAQCKRAGTAAPQPCLPRQSDESEDSPLQGGCRSWPIGQLAGGFAPDPGDPNLDQNVSREEASREPG